MERRRRLRLPRPARGGSGRRAGHFVAGARSAQQRVCALPAVRARRRRARGSRRRRAAPTALAGEPGLADRGRRHALDGAAVAVTRCCSRSSRCASRPARSTACRRRAARGVARCRRPRCGANRIVLDGAPVDVGFSIDLTIDPALQALAQKTAACYTGRHDVLPRARHARARTTRTSRSAQPLLEGAMVRMAAVAVIDVASGRIEALAGALSPCARQEVDGPGRDAACDTRLPYPIRYRARRAAQPGGLPRRDAGLDDQADHGRGVPRPIRERRRALARGRARGDAARRHAGARQPARPADALGLGALPRPHVLHRAGLRRLPPAVGRAGGGVGVRLERRLRRRRASDCGKRDLLFGGAVGAATSAAATAPLADAGRLRPPDERAARPARLGAPMRLMPPMALDAGIVRRCAAGADGRRGSDDDWEKCRGGAVVDVVAEGWGQGHARASALGVAGMMATLAAAANGQARGARGRIWSTPCAASPARRGRRVAAALRRAGRRRAAAAPAVARRRRGHPERPVVQPPRRHRAHRVRAGVRRARAAATSTGSPARPARRASRATASRSTSSRACARRARRDARSASAAPAARCGPTSGTSPPIAPTAPSAGPWTKAIAVLDRAQLAARRAAASTAPATTARTRRPRSRCRSSAARPALIAGAAP